MRLAYSAAVNAIVMHFLFVKLPKLLGLVVLIAMSTLCHAKEWRGIIPMHSTREDVNRLLGTSPDFNDVRANYSLENEDVYIAFSNNGSYQECARRLPKDTVLLIQITPKTNLQLSDLHLDQAALRRFEPSSPPGIGYAGFIDDIDGLVVRTFKGRVDQIAYVANSDDRKLCLGYYENIQDTFKLIVDLFARKFDEFGNLPLGDVKARLDNFAIQLQNEPESIGYLVFIGVATSGPPWRRRARRAKNYLASKRNMRRIVIIEGGRREQFAFELYLHPRDLPPPTPNPDPDVKPRRRA